MCDKTCTCWICSLGGIKGCSSNLVYVQSMVCVLVQSPWPFLPSSSFYRLRPVPVKHNINFLLPTRIELDFWITGRCFGHGRRCIDCHALVDGDVVTFAMVATSYLKRVKYAKLCLKNNTNLRNVSLYRRIIPFLIYLITLIFRNNNC